MVNDWGDVSIIKDFVASINYNDKSLPYFYLLPKVHKTPWATRPVVSGVSSVLEPLSKWVDIQLQRVVHLCPAYLKDSWHFLNEMKNLDILDEYRIVTSDAKAMYVNINTDHAIETIWLPHAQATQVWKTEWRRTDDMDHKKDRCEQPHMNDLVVIFIIFNHLTKLLFCLFYYQVTAPLLLSVKTTDPKAYFLIRFKSAKSVVCIYFYFAQ